MYLRSANKTLIIYNCVNNRDSSFHTELWRKQSIEESTHGETSRVSNRRS
jgi:hypothetical protein